MLVIEYLRMWMLLLCGVQAVTVLHFLWLDLCRHTDLAFGGFDIDPTPMDGIVDLSRQHGISAP